MEEAYLSHAQHNFPAFDASNYLSHEVLNDCGGLALESWGQIVPVGFPYSPFLLVYSWTLLMSLYYSTILHPQKLQPRFFFTPKAESNGRSARSDVSPEKCVVPRGSASAMVYGPFGTL